MAEKQADEGDEAGRHLHAVRMVEHENDARVRWYRGRLERGEHHLPEPCRTPGLQEALQEASRCRAERYRTAERHVVSLPDTGPDIPPPDHAAVELLSEMFPPPAEVVGLLTSAGRRRYLVAAVAAAPPHRRFRYPVTQNMRFGWDVRRLSADMRVVRHAPLKQSLYSSTGVHRDPDHQQPAYFLSDPWLQLTI